MKKPEIVIIGAGPAGISAAATLVEAGYKPTILDENPRPGGQIYRQPSHGISRQPKKLYGFDTAEAVKLHETSSQLSPSVRLVLEATVFNVSPGVVNLERNEKIEAVPFTHLVIACGAMDRVLPFRGWTLPGVFTLGGSQALLKHQATAIGERPAFFGTGPLLYLVAYQYLRAGIKVQAVLDTSNFSNLFKALPGLATWPKHLLRGVHYFTALPQHRVPLFRSIRQISATAGEAGSVGSICWTDADGREGTLACDALATGFNLNSQTQLADLIGCTFSFDDLQRQWLPEIDEDGRSSVEGVYLAGDGVRIRGAEMAELTGRQAAYALLADVDVDVYESQRSAIRNELHRREVFRRALDNHAFPLPSGFLSGTPDDLVICRCENVTAGEIRDTVRNLGACEINKSKAFSRMGMGRCQGRVCSTAAVEILAEQLGTPVRTVGRLRGQMPVKPLRLATLASGTQEP